jgi:helix-turn-helix protein
MEKMEDMSATAGISGGGSGAAEKVLGKSESDRINKIYKKIVKSRMREVIRFRAELSTPAGDN